MDLQLTLTEDGSLSLFDPETSQLHHNRAGAYFEALVNYVVPSGVLDVHRSRNTEVVALDVCFGLGYNTFVMISELLNRVESGIQKISVVAIETDVRVLHLIPKILEYSKFAVLARQINWPSQFTDCTRIEFDSGGVQVELAIYLNDARVVVPRLVSEGAQYDLIFHDPFSSKYVPELWSVDLFKCYHKLLQASEGRMMTYSAGAGVRGSLLDAGFYLWRSTALGGKSGGTVATISDSIDHTDCAFALNKDELSQLNSVSGVPYRDPNLWSTRKQVRDRRTIEQTEWKASQPTKTKRIIE